MPVLWSDAELNQQADDVAARCSRWALHTGDPGDLGADDEATGGSPAYARQNATFSAAGAEGPLGSQQPATEGTAWGTATFDVPAGTYSWMTLRTSGGAFRGRVKLPTPYVATEQAEVVVSLPFTA